MADYTSFDQTTDAIGCKLPLQKSAAAELKVSAENPYTRAEPLHTTFAGALQSVSEARDDRFIGTSDPHIPSMHCRLLPAPWRPAVLTRL